MTFIELLIIAIGVSMDAFAVSICKGLSVSRLQPKHVLSTGLWFGGFQALMPVVGYYAGVHFSDLVSNVDHWIAFVLLAFIGYEMVKESRDKDCDDVSPDFSFRTMLAMAVATSIDALAIGVSFAFLKVDIWMSVLLIGLTTGLFSMAGVRIGNVFGLRFKSTAELLGGLILIIMGVKILVEHTLLQ
jgi:putative Mn2+ efflux pump MntP